MEEARRMDGQDRYLNWKAAKYLMQAGSIEEASRLLGLFTKVRHEKAFGDSGVPKYINRKTL